MSGLIDPTQRILEQALDGLSRRTGALASNLANIDTPGYRPQSVDFEAALRAELDSRRPGTAGGGGRIAPLPPSTGPSAATGLRATAPNHLPGMPPAPTGALRGQPFDGSLRNDGNTVDLESELTALADTQLRFGAVSELIGGKLAMLRTVIGGA